VHHFHNFCGHAGGEALVFGAVIFGVLILVVVVVGLGYRHGRDNDKRS
jgi:hypothetical protein